MAALLAVVWHYWLAVPLAAGAILFTIGTVVMYFKKVTSTQYPD